MTTQKDKEADQSGRLLFCLYPLLLLLSRLPRHLGYLLLVLLRPLLHHFRRRQLPLVPGFCRILEDPRSRFESTMECQRGRGAESQPCSICLGEGSQGSHLGPTMQGLPGTKAVPSPTTAHTLCLSCRNSSREFD